LEGSLDVHTEYSAPVPAAEPAGLIGGPSPEETDEARSGSTIGCSFSLYDPEEGLYDFSYQAWLKDHSTGSPLVSGNNNVYQKPAINGSLSTSGYGGTFKCEVDLYIGASLWGTLAVVFSVCDDERDNMIDEYRQAQLVGQPECSDLHSSGGTTHFTWSELNGGFSGGNPHNPWGWVEEAMKTALESTRTEYDRGGIQLSSGYRCPHGNATLPGAAPNSLHQFGLAADMQSAEHDWTEEEFDLLRSAANTTGPSELLNWNSYSDHHLHAAW
jgi:hypothetical protein